MVPFQVTTKRETVKKKLRLLKAAMEEQEEQEEEQEQEQEEVRLSPAPCLGLVHKDVCQDVPRRDAQLVNIGRGES